MMPSIRSQSALGLAFLLASTVKCPPYISVSHIREIPKEQVLKYLTPSFYLIPAASSVQTPTSGDPIFPTDLFLLEYVQSIKVTNYAFASAIPAEFESSDFLTSLDLTGNSLTGTLPDALFELRSLTSLDLSNNGLSGNLGDKSKIKQLVRLTNINLGTNAFTGSIPTCELSTKPTTIIADCSEVTCGCCTTCADATTGTV